MPRGIVYENDFVVDGPPAKLGLSALYDRCVQQGSLNKAHDTIRKRVERERPENQFQLVRIAVSFTIAVGCMTGSIPLA